MMTVIHATSDSYEQRSPSTFQVDLRLSKPTPQLCKHVQTLRRPPKIFWSVAREHQKILDHSLTMAASQKASASGKSRSSTSKEAFGKKVKGENFYHDAKKVGKRKMMNSGKPVYDRDGKIVQAAAFQKAEAETTPGRVQPDRRWFGASCS